MGIGESIATLLARAGANLILFSRSEVCYSNNNLSFILLIDRVLTLWLTAYYRTNLWN